MVEKVVRTVGAKQGEGASAKAPPGTRLKPNLGVRFVVKEQVRKERDGPVHMSDIRIPGPG